MNATITTVFNNNMTFSECIVLGNLTMAHSEMALQNAQGCSMSVKVAYQGSACMTPDTVVQNNHLQSGKRISHVITAHVIKG